MRIGLFGGSFDPVHNGHIKLALAAREQFKLDCVVFVPARMPPHKLKKTLSSVADRLVMLYLAIRPYPRFRISPFELKRKKTTYTFETIDYFKRLLPGAKLYFIAGSDSLLELKTWKRADRLLSSCTFITGRRKGAPVAKGAPYLDRVQFVKGGLPAISSSDIRERVQQGKSIKKLVPPDVEKYIANRELYR